MRKEIHSEKKYADKLSRFRNDVRTFSEQFGGVKQTKKGFKAPITRKEKRKLERKLKHAKNLAFTKKEKMPTLENLIQMRKKPSKLSKQAEPTTNEVATTNSSNNNNTKTKPKLTEAKPPTTKKKADTNVRKPNSIELVETKLLNEAKKKKKYEQSTQKSLKHKLLEDNEQEEKEIKRLEKLLHIKKGNKKYKQAFVDEGFGDLLDFCDEEKRKEIVKAEGNIWLDIDSNDDDDTKKAKKAKLDLANKKWMQQDGSMSDENEDQDEQESNEDQDEMLDQDSQDEGEDDEDAESSQEENESINEGETDQGSEFSDEMNQDDEMSHDDDDDENDSENREEKDDKPPKGLKEDIYGRLVDKKGNVVKSEKYIPPAQRLRDLLDKSTSESSVKLAKLSKQINGLLNRLSTANMHSICNQIIQMFFSNQFTRYELIETIYSLYSSSLIKSASVTPIRLLVEHAALVCILNANIGVELGANLLQRFCMRINEYFALDSYLCVENKTLDNLILLICNLYNFKLFSSNLLIDLMNSQLVERIVDDERLEKIVDLILIIFKCVGLGLRKDNPVLLKDVIVSMQTKITAIRNKSNKNDGDDTIGQRLKFMIESINAIKNNDIRKLDAYDQEPIEHIRKQAKVLLKEDQTNQLNISFKDLISANELGRWWIVGSAWQLKENESLGPAKSNELTASLETKNGEGFSEKILKLAKEQHMNTDIRRAIFCVTVSAEDYTDAFMKLIKLSLKKQQEREIIYVIMHCALNEKVYNPYYSYLMQKFCQYDRRFKMTLTFHTWDKFKMLTSMTKQQISNLAFLICHLIGSDCITLSILKNFEFGEMNKYMVQFLSDMLRKLFSEQTDQRFQEIFLRISAINKLSQLRNALKLFIAHFILTDKGKTIDLDEKLKTKCDFAQKYLSINSND